MTERSGTERAFTLIELVVAMALASIAIAMIVGLVTNVFGSSEKASARTQSQKAAVTASEQLTHDARAMRAPQRNPKFTGPPDGLRELLLRQDNPTGLVVHDILEATPTRLVFFADLFAQYDGFECVTWAVDDDGSLVRTVRRYSATCQGGAVLQETVMLPATSSAVASAANPAALAPFSYRLLVQPRPGDADPDTTMCRTETHDTAATPLLRDQIVGIGFDMNAFVIVRSSRGSQELHASVAVTGRQSEEYRYALGCLA